MQGLREQQVSGIDALRVATALLQRARKAHPTLGLYEAADLQWWWRTARSTDELPQLFWFDHRGDPVAAVIATDWGKGIALTPIVIPGAEPQWVTQVIERGLAHADECAFATVDLEVDRSDDVMREILVQAGFTMQADTTGASTASISVIESWLEAQDLPAISVLHDDYRLLRRLDTMPHPHHMTQRIGPDVEQRLRQTSLYRPDLDLVVFDGRDSVAAYGLFWFDPETATGLVEPMRTEAAHQRRGLARHVLTSGIHQLVAAGAKRIKICFEPDNPASSGLYTDVGFVPVKETVVYSRRRDRATTAS